MHSSTRPLFVRWAVMGNACRTAERRALKDLARTTGGHIRTNFAGRHRVHLPRNLGLDEPAGVALVVVDSPRSRSSSLAHSQRPTSTASVSVPNRIELRFCMAFPAALTGTPRTPSSRNSSPGEMRCTPPVRGVVCGNRRDRSRPLSRGVVYGVTGARACEGNRGADPSWCERERRGL